MEYLIGFKSGNEINVSEQIAHLVFNSKKLVGDIITFVNPKNKNDTVLINPKEIAYIVPKYKIPTNSDVLDKNIVYCTDSTNSATDKTFSALQGENLKKYFI